MGTRHYEWRVNTGSLACSFAAVCTCTQTCRCHSQRDGRRTCAGSCCDGGTSKGVGSRGFGVSFDSAGKRDNTVPPVHIVTCLPYRRLCRDVARFGSLPISVAMACWGIVVQCKATTREWDLNAPHGLTAEAPARLGDDDPRCGVASLQRFAGEDLKV